MINELQTPFKNFMTSDEAVSCRNEKFPKCMKAIEISDVGGIDHKSWQQC